MAGGAIGESGLNVEMNGFGGWRGHSVEKQQDGRIAIGRRVCSRPVASLNRPKGEFLVLDDRFDSDDSFSGVGGQLHDERNCSLVKVCVIRDRCNQRDVIDQLRI